MEDDVIYGIPGYSKKRMSGTAYFKFKTLQVCFIVIERCVGLLHFNKHSDFLSSGIRNYTYRQYYAI